MSTYDSSTDSDSYSSLDPRIENELENVVRQTNHNGYVFDAKLCGHLDLDAIQTYILSAEFEEIVAKIMGSRSYVADYMRFWVGLVSIKGSKVSFKVQYEFVKPIPGFFGVTLSKFTLVKYYSPNSPIADFRWRELRALQISDLRHGHYVMDDATVDGIMNTLCHQQLRLHNIELPQGYVHTFHPHFVESVRPTPKTCQCVIC